MQDFQKKYRLQTFLYICTATIVGCQQPSPHILEKTNLTHCQDCLVVPDRGHVITILCKVSQVGGYNLSRVYITVDGVERHTVFFKEQYQCHYRASRDDHRREVTCEAVYFGIDRPLVDFARFFVIDVPSISLSTPPQIEGSPSSVTCNSSPGRPPPDLSILVNGVAVIASHADFWNPLNDTYESVAQLEMLFREWDGQSIVCCMKYILDSSLNQDSTCTETREIRYLHNPDSIQIDATLDTDEDNVTWIFLECTIRNANPPCKANWIYPDPCIPDTDVKTIVTREVYGFTTYSTISLNIVAGNQGQTVQCEAVCFRAKPVLTSRYTIDIWKIMEESNVTDIGQSEWPVMRSRGSGMPHKEQWTLVLIACCYSFGLL